ncbi:MAG: aldo/keto reductase [Propionibacteriaceae bacterium]|jgi:aryl-alcohol dehydrogenase-like predicted oxidoreductase|nr:aldo/keto reductase [Propionibacteriaceae bacterium]
MKYTYLGRTGLKVSRLCLGTMNWGPHTDEKDAFAIMDKALEEGVTFFDTANVYGGRGPAPEHAGWTEEIIGRWFAQGGGRRESVVLATKFYNSMSDQLDGPNDAPGVSAYKMRRHLQASLTRLQTDHVELYQMHHIDRHAPWDEIWGAYEAVIDQGLVVYAGSSNFGARHLCYAQAAAHERHFLGLVSEQHRYNLACRLPELEVLPAAQELGLGVIPWSPLAGGLLAGHIAKPAGGSAAKSRTAEAMANLSETERDQITRYTEFCRELGESEANVALAWLLANPAVTAPIIGPSRIEQLTDALRAVEIDLDAAALAALDEIFPGPGGAAPEAYAW